MKKIITLIAFCIAGIGAELNAQEISIKGGVNLSNMSTYIDSESGFLDDDRQFKVGYNVGLSGMMKFNDYFGFEAGLIFNTKGLKYTETLHINSGLGLSIDGEYEQIFKKDILYLDVPLSAKVMYPLANNIRVHGKVGPYVGIALTGNDKYFVKKDGERFDLPEAISELSSSESSIEFGEDINELKALDYGLQMGAGVNIGGFLVEGIYKFSLGDLDNFDGSNTKNHVFSLSLGYTLGR